MNEFRSGAHSVYLFSVASGVFNSAAYSIRILTGVQLATTGRVKGDEKEGPKGAEGMLDLMQIERCQHCVI